MSNSLLCAICLDNENDNDANVDKMLTRCNHYFHKQCFYRTNYDKFTPSCPLCRKVHTSMYETYLFPYSEVSDKDCKTILTLRKFTKTIGIDEYIVSDGCAVYMFQQLTGKRPKWENTDIDIYHASSKKVFFDSEHVHTVRCASKSTTQNPKSTMNKKHAPY